MGAQQYLTELLPGTRCEPELKAAMVALAEKEDRELAAVIRRACRELVDREKKATK